MRLHDSSITDPGAETSTRVSHSLTEVLSERPGVAPGLCVCHRHHRKHKPGLRRGPARSFIRSPCGRVSAGGGGGCQRALWAGRRQPQRLWKRRVHARACEALTFRCVCDLAGGAARLLYKCLSGLIADGFLFTVSCVNTRLREPQTLLASLPAHTGHNKLNRQTVKGEKHTRAGRKARTQTQRKVWFGKG